MATIYEEIKIGSKADTRGFKKAESAAAKLNKTLRNLGLALGTTALVSYGKASVKAFAADEAAARRLATAVDNLGLSFSQSRVTEFIKNLETSSAIADDVLRPAFQALLTTTGSLTKSQELLNNAIQISRASGIDLATVSQDLANGYVGITRGLKKYNTGLTQAELKSKSFADILGIMLVKSAGSANAYLETTQYKLDALTLAGNNAKETIGAGLVDAFARIAGGSETSDAVKAIDNIAKAINGVTAATGFLVGGLVKLYKGLDFLTTFGGLTGANGSLVGILEGKPSTNRSKSPAGTAARTAQQRAAETAAAARAKELAGLTKKQVASQKALTAEQKKQNALKKAGTVFDLEQIQLVAALKGKLSDNEKLRVEAQLALLNGNEAVATKLTNQILAAQDASGNLAKFLAALPNAKNPFEYLDAYLSYLANKAAAIITNQPVPSSPSAGSTTVPTIPSTNVPAMPSDGTISYNQSTGLTYNPNANNAPVINVTVQGNVIREQELINQVLAGAQLSSLSGSPSQIGRIAGMFS
jgi:hypothetical protein